MSVVICNKLCPTVCTTIAVFDQSSLELLRATRLATGAVKLQLVDGLTPGLALVLGEASCNPQQNVGRD